MQVRAVKSSSVLVTTLLLVSCGGAAAPLAPSPSASATTRNPAASALEQAESGDRAAGRPAAAKPAEASNPAPAAAASAANTAGQAAPGQVGITLGPPKQLFHENQPDAFGMSDVPDQQPAILLQADGSYLVFLNGRFASGPAKDNAGYVALFSTKDFLTYAPLARSGATAAPVFGPLCDLKRTCLDQAFDADYLGANMVFQAHSGSDLLMIYNGTNTDFGGTRSKGSYYAEIGLARSPDHGAHWSRSGVIVQGTDPKPAANQASGASGTPQPGGIIAGDYIYLFYPYFPTKGSPDDGPAAIQGARAPVAQDGAPGSWMKFYNGSFSEPGLRPGRGSQMVLTGECKRPAQPSVSFSGPLNLYLMTFLCEQGWFFSTSPDLQKWTTPSQFFVEPSGEFQEGQPTDENMTLVTPGKPAGVIEQTGYVLYSNRASWGHGAGEFWLRPFTVSR